MYFLEPTIMINFFPNFLGCKYKMFTSMRECFSFQVCLQAYFFPFSFFQVIQLSSVPTTHPIRNNMVGS